MLYIWRIQKKIDLKSAETKETEIEMTTPEEKATEGEAKSAPPSNEEPKKEVVVPMEPTPSDSNAVKL